MSSLCFKDGGFDVDGGATQQELEALSFVCCFVLWWFFVVPCKFFGKMMVFNKTMMVITGKMMLFFRKMPVLVEKKNLLFQVCD